jgi:glycosyltransferase involved in cell wall biosynthesis
MTRAALLDPCVDVAERRPLDDGGRIRVLELLATGTSGGAQEHVLSLVSRLDRRRYEPLVVSLSDGAAVRRMRAAGQEVIVLGETDDAAAVSALSGLLEERPTDVVHNHMYRAEIVGTRAALAVAERGRTRPYVVGTVHSSRIRSTDDRALLRALTPRMDRLIAVSRAIVRKLEAEGRDSVRIELIHNGVDLSRYDHQEPCCTLREEYGFPDDAQICGVVARLEPEKGHPTLLDAWPFVIERVPGARLLVVGEGSRREALEDQAERLGLLGHECEGDACVGTRSARPGATVVFTGRRDDVPAVTAALDVAVLPSYREAQGIVILEAMALGRPVVASRVGGIPEMITDGQTGLLVPPRDPGALAAAIVRLLTDHPLADTLGRAGHDMVHDRFCIERMVESIQTIYDEGAAAVRGRAGAGRGDAVSVAGR